MAKMRTSPALSQQYSSGGHLEFGTTCWSVFALSSQRSPGRGPLSLPGVFGDSLEGVRTLAGISVNGFRRVEIVRRASGQK